jgi:uncharacterized protein with ParB-like and HNH nuclease domain
MANNTIELKSIEELLTYNFFIPNYQRGYRWTKQQVKDLLNDIYEFQLNGGSGIYCIQPLVVKKRYDNSPQIMHEIHSAKDLSSVEDWLTTVPHKWDVIDGQQRLTTILILLSYLNNSQKYSIEYGTRKCQPKSDDPIKKNIGSKDFLSAINLQQINVEEAVHNISDIAKANIDFEHIYTAFQSIKGWFEGYENEKGEHISAIYGRNLKEDIDKSDFKKILLTKVKFIWYETKESDPIKVFTRLNIGKIALTDAELIKALFLNSTNFKTNNKEKIRLQQIEIASEWDRIEYALQDDEFWLFLHDLGYSKATRIDFIFDLIKDKDIFKLKDKLGKDYDEAIGTDEHQTFRYFYEHFKQNRNDIDTTWLRNSWGYVKKYYLIFEEWYNDLELYHYIGYLIATGSNISDIVNLYANEKTLFIKDLKELIKKRIRGCKDLNRDYGDNGEKKRECFPLLLLFNIQTVINQNRSLKNAEKYGMGTTYKFPFHLFKKEGKKKNGKGWEVEHIASNSGDDLDDIENQKIWLAAMLYGIVDEEIRREIEDFLNDKSPKTFEVIRQDLAELDINPITGINKQKIWNYALLDSATNEEYQNDPFPIKRICIMAKEQGHKAQTSYDEKEKRININKDTISSAFVPPCTKNVFTKAYTDIPKSLGSWSIDDATLYKEAIYQTLQEFGVTK